MKALLRKLKWLVVWHPFIVKCKCWMLGHDLYYPHKKTLPYMLLCIRCDKGLDIVDVIKLTNNMIQKH